MGFGFSETLAEEQSVAANTLRFGPIRQDVEWDGESFASVTVPARCVNTNATHTVSVAQIFTANQSYVVDNIPVVVGLAGDPVIYAAQNFTTGTNGFSLTPMVSTAGDVTFSLVDSTAWSFSPANSTWPPELVNTTRPRFFQYRVDSDNGTAKTVLAVGLVTRLPVNVIRQSVTVSTGGGTAQQCPT
jgi:hypothetical protein